MPEMDGFALCRQIKADEMLKEIPVMLVTGLSSPHDVVRGLESGADNFIRKPYDEKNLLQRIHYILANRALRKSENVQMGLEIDLNGQRHFITAERQQILDLLISTYEEAVRLNADLQRSNQSLQGLFRIAEGLNESVSEQDVVAGVLARAMELPGVQAGWIFLHTGAATFQTAGTHNLPPALEAGGAMEGDCLCRRKLLAGELDHVTNILECERLQTAIGDTRGLRYHASIPLWSGETLRGIMNLAGAEEGLFSDEDLRTLYTVGHQVGQALERARLHQHLEELVEERTAALTAEIAVRKRAEEEIELQLRRLAALREIDTAITGGTDLPMTLGIVLGSVMTQLNVDAACVYLLNAHQSTLEYVAGRGFRTRAAQTARIRLGESAAGRAALDRRTVITGKAEMAQSDQQFASLWAEEGFAAHRAVPLIAKGEVKGVLEVFHRLPLNPEPEWVNFLETLGGQAAIAIDNAQLFDHLQRSNVDLWLAYDATIEGWSRALDLRDRETEGHTRRVTEITLRLAQEMEISEEELVHVRRGGLLHDIGKMGVPDSILLKPGPLTDDEWDIMRQHPQYAHDMLSPINYLRPALDIPYCHHEKWDGTGYPRRLRGEQIPLAARIFAVVDVCDALRSDRPYRNAWTDYAVREHLKSLSGLHFDPQILEVCVRSEVLWNRKQ
nr:GAF domain-containing protein [Chloroflexota bacterium]